MEKAKKKRRPTTPFSPTRNNKTALYAPLSFFFVSAFSSFQAKHFFIPFIFFFFLVLVSVIRIIAFQLNRIIKSWFRVAVAAIFVVVSFFSLQFTGFFFFVFFCFRMRITSGLFRVFLPPKNKKRSFSPPDAPWGEVPLISPVKKRKPEKYF